ncbi:MAG: STAS domain-containing protein [Spirochaetia bacterium]|nr:STAS domain-containing protein [Spirochaetia bacterium]
MEIHCKHQNEVCVFFLEGELLVNNAMAVAGMIRSKGSDYDVYALNLSGVEAIDTAGVQALMHLKKDFTERGKVFKLIAHSAQVIQFFDLYGLAPYFGDKIHVKSEDMKNYAFSYGVRKSEVNENISIEEK